MTIDKSRWDWIAHEVYRRLLAHAVKYGVSGFGATPEEAMDEWVKMDDPDQPEPGSLEESHRDAGYEPL